LHKIYLDYRVQCYLYSLKALSEGVFKTSFTLNGVTQASKLPYTSTSISLKDPSELKTHSNDMILRCVM